jgi:hypothetical protein
MAYGLYPRNTAYITSPQATSRSTARITSLYYIAYRAALAPALVSYYELRLEPSRVNGESKLQRDLATALATHPPIFLDGRLGESY